MASLKPKLLSLHVAYFILMSMIGSVILYIKSAHINDLHYVDALFMSFSAMTGTGLSVLDLSTLNILQQGTLFLLLILGHAIPLHGVISFLSARNLRSVLTVNSDKRRQWQTIIHKPILQNQEAQDLKEQSTTLSDKLTSPLKTHIIGREIHAEIPSLDEPVSHDARRFVIITNQSHAGQSQQFPSNHQRSVGDLKTCLSWISIKLKSVWPRTNNLHSSSNSIGPGEPGWVEYKALILISGLTMLYTIVFLFVGIGSIGLWLKLCRPDIPQADGVSPFWAGAFLATSAFSNNGMSLIDASMAPFQLEPTPLLICSFLILAGNTLFPCLLRLVIWIMRKALPDKPKWRVWRRTFDLILTRPQNVCAFLYPAWHTWFLLGTVLMLNGIMWGAFELASIGNSEIAALPFKFRVLDGLFQSSAVRGGGFSVVTFGGLPQGLLALYVLMMYLPSYPLSAAIRGTNPHQKGLTKVPCLEAGESVNPSPESGSNISILTRSYFYYRQLRFQLSHDVWWLSVAVLLICVAESTHYTSQPLAFSTFNIIFEVVSAYSYVGVSVGYPGKNYSFCGEWTSFSKVLLIFISFLGRHRDLPVSNGNFRWSHGSEEAAEQVKKLQEINAQHFSSATVRVY